MVVGKTLGSAYFASSLPVRVGIPGMAKTIVIFGISSIKPLISCTSKWGGWKSKDILGNQKGLKWLVSPTSNVAPGFDSFSIVASWSMDLLPIHKDFVIGFAMPTIQHQMSPQPWTNGIRVTQGFWVSVLYWHQQPVKVQYTTCVTSRPFHCQVSLQFWRCLGLIKLIVVEPCSWCVFSTQLNIICWDLKCQHWN